MTINKVNCGDDTSVLLDSVNGLIDGRVISSSNVVILGDSITAQNTSSSAVLESFENKGYFVVANHELGGAFDLLNNAGVGGERTDQIFDRIPADVIAYNPSICIVLAGTNDLAQAVPVATITVNLINIYTALTDAGITPVLCTIPSSDLFLTEPHWDEVNLFIAEYASLNNLKIVDFASSLIDANNAVFPYHFTNATVDGTHPSKLGAKAMGDALSVVLEPLKGDPYTPPSSNNNSKNLVSNTLLTGVGGSLFGNCVGVAPNDWVLNDLTADANTTITCSLVDNQDHQTIKMVQANTGSGASTVDAFTSFSAGVSAGITIQAYVEMSVEGLVNCSQFEARLRVRDISNADLFEIRALGRAESLSIPSYTQIGKIKFPQLTLPVGADDIIVEILVISESGTIIISKPAIMVVG